VPETNTVKFKITLDTKKHELESLAFIHRELVMRGKEVDDTALARDLLEIGNITFIIVICIIVSRDTTTT
jgi:hypothetical protein